MINCKKHIIAAGFMLALPLVTWSEAAVVDDSDNFAIVDRSQTREASVSEAHYDDSYAHSYDDEGPALAKDDQVSGSGKNRSSDDAALIDKIKGLEQEVQELRGQLEVQAHDLKLLQQQQLAFYKDLDSRLSGGNATAKAAPGKPSLDLDLGSNTTATAASIPVTSYASRANPADEQISYLAAYELVKNKRFDEAVSAMNNFVQKYPRGGYTANAQYWLGELYLVKNEHANAIEHFDVVLQQFPTSSKAAASMLKVGYAYAAMGNKPEAEKFLQQVVRAYPNTPTAQLASSKLKTI